MSPCPPPNDDASRSMVRQCEKDLGLEEKVMGNGIRERGGIGVHDGGSIISESDGIDRNTSNKVD